MRGRLVASLFPCCGAVSRVRRIVTHGKFGLNALFRYRLRGSLSDRSSGTPQRLSAAAEAALRSSKAGGESRGSLPGICCLLFPEPTCQLPKFRSDLHNKRLSVFFPFTLLLFIIYEIIITLEMSLNIFIRFNIHSESVRNLTTLDINTQTKSKQTKTLRV